MIPSKIFDFVAKEFNCEDIAMSFFVSSLNEGQVPLLAERWAQQCMAKMESDHKISATDTHTVKRHQCVQVFAEELGIHKISRHLFPGGTTKDLFDQNLLLSESSTKNGMIEREIKLREMLSDWTNEKFKQKCLELIRDTVSEAYERGLISQSIPWSKRLGLEISAKTKKFHSLFPR